jgi:hypothetical protein
MKRKRAGWSGSSTEWGAPPCRHIKGEQCGITLAPGQTLQSRVSHNIVLGAKWRCVGGDRWRINTEQPRQVMAPAADADAVGIGQDESKGQWLIREKVSYGWGLNEAEWKGGERDRNI